MPRDTKEPRIRIGGRRESGLGAKRGCERLLQEILSQRPISHHLHQKLTQTTLIRREQTFNPGGRRRLPGCGHQIIDHTPKLPQRSKV